MAFNEVKYSIVKQRDGDLIKSLTTLISETERRPNSFIVSFIGGIPQHTVNLDTLDEDITLNSIISDNSFVIQRVHLEYERNFKLSISRSPQFTDDVTIQPGADHNQEAWMKYISVSRNLLKVFEVDSTLSAFLSDQGKEFLAAREANLAKLESIATSLINDGQKYRDSLDAQFDAKVTKLMEESALKAKQLEEEHRARIQKMEKKEAEIEERAKSLDDRESRHVRRELYKNQKKKFEEIANKFELTKGTKGLRLPIHIFTFLLFGGLAALEVYLVALMLDKSPSGSIEWFVTIGRQLLVAGGLCATAVFYLKFTNRWFEQHAQEEFRLKRLDIDVDRASWLVETAMEWRELRENDMPDALLERLSRNLFEDPQQDDRPLHPIDNLASQVLGTSAELELPFGKGKVSLDRKSIKDLKKVSNS